MSFPIIYVAVTSHGFGHAARTASVVATIKKLCPETLLILVTTTPRWFLESYIQHDFIYRPRSFDVGVVQSDSLTMDKAATLEKMQHIRSQQNAIIAGEVNFIKQNRVGLILADVPHLAGVIGKTAGVPCWTISNFGWDFIYRNWGSEFQEIADWISDCYSQCDRLLRLPFHEPMSAFKHITDFGLPGGSPSHPADALRSQWNITSPRERTVLLTFGGLGLQQIPYDNVQRFPDWQFITFARNAPDLPNLLKVTDPQYRPVDFMQLCSKVVSKPGFSTFAEAIRQQVPIVTLTRDDFAEAALLIEGIRDYAHHQIINPAEFFHSDWEFLQQVPLTPRKSQAIALDGNEAIAHAVLEYFQ
ncbi:glycosyl transferase [Gloeocapsopsis dulcis]|uniref:Glycosyl transferase n=1 Tax=Gloeocapsopsis dulcis AAB1 = 1H9 TaxID=1433147 RepID=A0A6N8FYL0_9CHRO|nr:glycosyl transferase [Gloeocapsopsis dulcis]MUL37217.1 glycosyl transferase [Gloeocapsopsis dulcis AAB1 = 1H9]WNN90172.1 glycosyl transferase [Gloeocapsopsis dulcis]